MLAGLFWALLVHDRLALVLISVTRITAIEHIGRKILIKQQHELIILDKGNYEPETWAALKDGLDAFFADKSPILGAIKAANKAATKAQYPTE